ncbi:hypothetical protein TWF694_001487 [Orbilia ellipsospora]|uniref:Uncharacterized protein n=1 Tax=Orbilia ellipsospora TaxID=2528407 RepID=A0AAV9XRT1_9PEZI
MGVIRIVNETSTPVEVFVSKYNGGDDHWFNLPAGGSDTWTREEGAGGGWEVAAFRDGFDTNRVGRYVRVNSKVVFKGFDEVLVFGL